MLPELSKLAIDVHILFLFLYALLFLHRRLIDPKLLEADPIPIQWLLST